MAHCAVIFAIAMLFLSAVPENNSTDGADGGLGPASVKLIDLT